MNRLGEIIAGIGTFMICAQAVVHFRPKECYAKYLRLLLGVMVLFQLLQAFWGLFFGAAGKRMEESVTYFQESLEAGMEEALAKGAASEELLEEISLQKLQEQARESVDMLRGQGEEHIFPIEETAIEVAPVKVPAVEGTLPGEQREAAPGEEEAVHEGKG